MARPVKRKRTLSPVRVDSQPTSARITRSKSLPNKIEKSVLTISPRNFTEFTLGTFKPSSTVVCNACHVQIAKSPEIDTTITTLRGRQLHLYVLEARKRNALIQEAYANALKDNRTLDNPDVSSERSPIRTQGHDHAPYAVDACELVGRLSGDLGRALASSQQGLAELEKLFADEKVRAEMEDDEQKKARAEAENQWWLKEKNDRLEEAKEKLKKRRKKKKPPFKRTKMT